MQYFHDNAVCHFSMPLPFSGTALVLPIVLKPTLHIVHVQVQTTQSVVHLDGEDA